MKYLYYVFLCFVLFHYSQQHCLDTKHHTDMTEYIKKLIKKDIINEKTFFANFDLKCILYKSKYYL